MDVRMAEEYAAGHPKGAVNKALKKGAAGFEKPDNFAADVQSLVSDKSQAVLVGCQSGRRSVMACGWLAEAGVTVINVDGGFSAWESAGLPVEK